MNVSRIEAAATTRGQQRQERREDEDQDEQRAEASDQRLEEDAIAAAAAGVAGGERVLAGDADSPAGRHRGARGVSQRLSRQLERLVVRRRIEDQRKRGPVVLGAKDLAAAGRFVNDAQTGLGLLQSLGRPGPPLPRDRPASDRQVPSPRPGTETSTRRCRNHG